MRADTGTFSAAYVARVCHGKLLCGDPDATFSAVSTDSRDIQANDLFVPIKGATHDGHDFLFPALEAGARGSLVHRDITRDIPQYLTKPVLIQVQDTLLCLANLASAHRKKYPIPLIAVTGSSGKTTVKEMIATALMRSHRPLVSQGNFNNLIGLPMTVLNLNLHHTAAVVEAGINMNGEMDHLAHAARPDVAVITTIGPVHLEGLGTVENVAREKFKLVSGLNADGIAVVPAGNPWLEPLIEDCASRVVTFGIEKGDYRVGKMVCGEETAFEMITPVGTQEMRISVPGRHNVANCLAAAAACIGIGMDLPVVAEALAGFTPPTWRMEVVRLSGDRTLLRDCYNANPLSVGVALEVLAGHRQGPKLALLADMMELGDRSAQLHEEIGREAARLGIDRLIHVGTFGSEVAQGFVDAGGAPAAVTVAPDKETAWEAIAPTVESFGTILVKGSRVMRMEILANLISEEK
jgi:UDP-N-acetylmuramoyl-tripeptide--D-alanyl-D-alanine ligase